MATLTSARGYWAQKETQNAGNTIWNKLAVFADKQKPNRTLWFLFSLVFQGIFFLPIPAALTYYYNAPMLLLVVTLTLFFANVIAGMGGSGIRTMLTLFAFSIIIHMAMVLIYIF